jgi:ethylbenzene hydroxylase subunit beta/complex iron-sulfur molybdoenzyme family reductase subunit beta
MVFDLNKCMGCQSCSVACKMLWTAGEDEGERYQWWCTVNTVPGRGTPRDWESMGGGYRDGELVLGHEPSREEFGGGWSFNHRDVFYGGKGESVHLAPTTCEGKDPNWGPNWDEDQGIGTGDYPNSYFFYLPRLCNHCTHPACVEACPSDAMYKRAEDGIVLRDEDACRGARDCIRACPYKKIYFNHERGVSQHCNFCFPRLEQGVAPACARNCPGRLAFVGRLDDEDGAIHKLVNVWKVALPLHPEYGTEPNVFYVPPLSPYRLNEDRSLDFENPRIPPDYLESLFGPTVHDALARLQGELDRVRGGNGSGVRSELLDTLIAYEWKSLFGPYTNEPAVVEPGASARDDIRDNIQDDIQDDIQEDGR